MTMSDSKGCPGKPVSGPYNAYVPTSATECISYIGDAPSFNTDSFVSSTALHDIMVSSSIFFSARGQSLQVVGDSSVLKRITIVTDAPTRAECGDLLIFVTSLSCDYRGPVSITVTGVNVVNILWSSCKGNSIE